MYIVLLIIAKNEIKNIKVTHSETMKKVAELNIDYCYIDGESNDGTIEFFNENNINYIQQKFRGRGGAILTGFNELKYDGYVIYSPDGNENINDLKTITSLLNSNQGLVIASRMMVGARNEEDDKTLRFRKWANKTFNYLINKLFNKSIFVSDSINGYRGITRHALDQIKLDAIDYTIEYQMTIQCMKKGIKITEFPTIEGRRIFGVTGAPSIRTGIAFLKRLYIEIFK
jgi:WD40 repeat protein